MFDTNASFTYASVMGLTTRSCGAIPYVRCDAQGNVIEAMLGGRGMTGVVQFNLFGLMPALKKLSLSYNRLSGSVLSSIFSSPVLEEVYLTKNMFTGYIPCPLVLEPRLTELSLANNRFTGALPACIFTWLPRLRDLDISYNRLVASVPSQIASAQQLTTFRAIEAGLSGSLPAELRCGRRLITLSLRGNALSGSLPQAVIDGLVMLNTLDLGYNNFTGLVPTFPTSLVELRNLYLNNNARAVGRNSRGWHLNHAHCCALVRVSRCRPSRVSWPRSSSRSRETRTVRSPPT